jgi:hypothetical protein
LEVIVMKTKVLSIALIVVLVLMVLSACSSDNASPSSTPSPAQETEPQVEASNDLEVNLDGDWFISFIVWDADDNELFSKINDVPVFSISGDLVSTWELDDETYERYDIETNYSLKDNTLLFERDSAGNIVHGDLLLFQLGSYGTFLVAPYAFCNAEIGKQETFLLTAPIPQEVPVQDSLFNDGYVYEFNEDNMVSRRSAYFNYDGSTNFESDNIQWLGEYIKYDIDNNGDALIYIKDNSDDIYDHTDGHTKHYRGYLFYYDNSAKRLYSDLYFRYSDFKKLRPDTTRPSENSASAPEPATAVSQSAEID